MIVRHLLDNTPDKRYTVAKEYDGSATIMHVARFCGKYIGSAKTKKEAWILAQEHYDNHKIDMAG